MARARASAGPAAAGRTASSADGRPHQSPRSPAMRTRSSSPRRSSLPIVAAARTAETRISPPGEVGGDVWRPGDAQHPDRTEHGRVDRLGLRQWRRVRRRQLPRRQAALEQIPAALDPDPVADPDQALHPELVEQAGDRLPRGDLLGPVSPSQASAERSSSSPGAQRAARGQRRERVLGEPGVRREPLADRLTRRGQAVQIGAHRPAVQRQVGDVAEARLVAPVVEQDALAVGGAMQRALVRVVGAAGEPSSEDEQRRAGDDADRIELQATDPRDDVAHAGPAGGGSARPCAWSARRRACSIEIVVVKGWNRSRAPAGAADRGQRQRRPRTRNPARHPRTGARH